MSYVWYICVGPTGLQGNTGRPGGGFPGPVGAPGHTGSPGPFGFTGALRL